MTVQVDSETWFHIWKTQQRETLLSSHYKNQEVNAFKVVLASEGPPEATMLKDGPESLGSGDMSWGYQKGG